MRTFVAAPVPEFIKKYAAMIKGEFEVLAPDIKWVEYENYHLTLKFLGDINIEQLERIKSKLELAGQNCPAFVLRIKGVGFFPNQRRPRVIWLGVEGELDKFAFLGDRIDAYLAQSGFEPENKRSFHLTLGRIRSEKNIKNTVAKALGLDKRIASREFQVTDFYLMESRLSSEGPQYLINTIFKLRG